MKEKENSFEIATGVIQKLLFDEPLYNYIDKDNVNILVFGFTELCQRFIDIAFEVSQVNAYKLNITVVSDNDEAKELYLNNRPAFKDFFEVNSESVDDSYGALTFVTNNFETDIDSVVSEFLLDEDKRYSYIFIDNNNDKENYKIASVCNICREMLYDDSVINFVSAKPRKTSKYLNVVLRNETIQNHKNYSKLKRMALNCHLLWNNSDFIDIRKLQRDFNKSYNYSSSLSNVLSIKYKLKSVGIDFDDSRAADKFYELSKNEKGKIEKLVKAEHDRWNVSMICKGWSTQKNLENCISGVKDKVKKLHPCIVRSNEKIVLGNSWKHNSFEKWDTADESEIEKLDSLDQVSVKLHRIFKTKENEIKSNNILFDNDIYEIQKQLLKYENANNAFSKYLVCIKNIIGGLSSQVRQYHYYKSKLLDSLKSVPNGVQYNIIKRVELMENTLFPIFECEKYTDYKAYDQILIKNIPFILTYKTNIHLGIPLETNNDNSANKVLFGNIASSLLINPSRVTYFYKYSDESVEKLAEALKYSCKCMDSHNVRAKINLCLISLVNIPEKESDIIKKISNRIHRIDFVIYKDEDELENNLHEYIKARRFTAIEKNSSETSGVFYGMRIFRKNPYYVFNSIKSEVNCFNNCNELKYIPFKSALKISDLFESKFSKDIISLPDFQQDYKFFWDIYRESYVSCSAWKCLCNALEKTYRDENLVTINVPKKIDSFCEKIYYVESSCVDAIKLVLNKLVSEKTDFRFKIEFHSNGIYKLCVNGTVNVHTQLTRLLSNPYLLKNQFDIEVDKSGAYVRVLLNNLVVGRLYEKTITENAFSLKNPYENIEAILDKLSENNYIIDLKKNKDCNGRYFSFCYTSHQLKELMTAAGRVLELYVYYKLMSVHSINEIANSVVVEREKSGAKNELDIVLTSGFKSMIIECKAQPKLKPDFYYKLDNLNRLFGINSKAILVADLNEKPEYDNSENRMQRNRGKDSGIITIYNKNDIDNIDETIKLLLNNV